MLRSILRLLAVTVVLAHVVVACDGGDLNPQPLPPAENSGKDMNDGTATGGGTSADAPSTQDAGATISLDGGADGGDAGDGGHR